MNKYLRPGTLFGVKMEIYFLVRDEQVP